jgi:polyisoprenoid-binding protein YceI
MLRFATIVAVGSLAAGAALAAPASYQIDPQHTYPSFAADHLGGLSVWRGKFNRSSGTITLDKSAGTGAVDVRIDVTSADFGLDAMNEKAAGPELFDTAKYPTAQYKGKLVDFKDGAPTRIAGELTLRGVTKPLDLQVKSFKCMPHPLNKRELCGADAAASFKRDDFGMDAGKAYGFDMNVALQIQVEALKNE